MRRSSCSFPFFVRNWISKKLSKRPGRTCGSASVKSWLAVAASALPSGNSARSGAEVWDWNIHRAFQRAESSETTCPRKPLFDDCLGCLLGRTCDSDRFRTSRRRQWRLRREQDLTEAEAYVRHACIPVNGNLFGNISTRRCYSTAHDPCSA